MLTTRALPQRAVHRPCFLNAIQTRCVVRIGRNKLGKWVKPPKRKPASTTLEQDDVDGSRSSLAPEAGKSRDDGTPSLLEQLFPEEANRPEAQQNASRDVPRLPLHALKVRQRKPPPDPKQSWAQYLQPDKNPKRAEMSAESGTAVLVLRNASKNLTEEDFRRLIPQGKHMEGWTLNQGDILKVIPGRSLYDLAQDNSYYLLFSSDLSAYTFQGHVTRIHRLAHLHTPTSVTSPIPPPPGYMIEGLDVQGAVQAYALLPPSQTLELRLLDRPFTPIVQKLVQLQGYPGVVKQTTKCPYEARLTMEGPQLSMSSIKYIMRETGRARGLSWSGGDNATPEIVQWRHRDNVSSQQRSVHGQKFAEKLDSEGSDEKSGESGSSSKDEDGQKRRTPIPVYIIGFHSENAATSFVQHWHRRLLEDKTDLEGDVPPIANVELMW